VSNPAVSELLPFNAWALGFIAAYLLSLLVIGWLGYRAKRDESLRDFYLGGEGVGFLVLLLTLYATQYSGNTLFGFSGRAYRQGFSWAICIHFMTAIIVVYLFFAPKLYAISRRESLITPSDFLQYRFGSTRLSLCAAVLMVLAISNYLLAQLMAMGRAMEGLTTVHPTQAYRYGVISLALIIVVYETMGGFRAVAWTDAIQGSVLLVGFAILMGMVFLRFGSLHEVTSRIFDEQPAKALPPDAATCRQWFSYVVLVGLGGALYPQSIQRIYSARSSSSLRRSLAIMAFLPLTTTLIAVIVGVTGAIYLPGLRDEESDRVLTIICREVQQESTFGYCLVVVIFAAVLAALMSTADSVLLSISSMVTKDIYGRGLAPHASEKELTRIGQLTSWVVIGSMTLVAVFFTDIKLVELLDQKFDLLVQLAPAFLIGIHWKKLRATPTFWGMVAGVAIALAVRALLGRFVWSLHAGIYGLLVNLAIAVGGSLVVRDHPQLPNYESGG